MPGNLISDVIDDYRNRALVAAFSFKDLVYRLFAFIITTSFILWLSIFLYVTFYYAYVPAVSHVRPVHLEFDTCSNSIDDICSNPTANVTLTHQRQLLQTSQPYNIIIDLEVPESEANKKLGMFMVKVTLTGQNGKVIAVSRRSSMLRYKTQLLEYLTTMIFSPALLTGPMEEKQLLKVEMFGDFFESPDNPVTNVKIEVETRKLQLYSAMLRIQAEFTGLRYFMVYWPVTSATIGISTHVVLLSFLVGYVWYRLLSPNQVVVRVGMNRTGNSSPVLARSLSAVPSQPVIATVEPQQPDQSKTLEQRRLEAKETLIKERQRQLSSSRLRSQSFTSPLDRSASFNSPPRIQELSKTGTTEPVEEQEDEGLVMRTDDTNSELRHRSTGKGDLSPSA